MDLPMGLSLRPNGSISNHPRRHLDLPSSLELQSSTLTAGRDLNINISAGQRKPSLPDVRQLAQWLSSLNQHQVHKDIFNKVTPGTGEWIFNNPQFMDWLAKNFDILWGTGIPGAGKTCLSSVIINHIIHHEQATVVFFYCQYKEQPRIEDIIACLLKQMVESLEDAAQYVALTIYTSCARTDTRPSLSELSKTLKETAQKFDNLFFVVDALDELSDDTRSDLISELAALQLPLLITSRPIPNLFDVEPTKFIIRSPDNDFYQFISAKISRVSKLKPFLRDQSIRAELIRSVQDKCDGMFLLAALQIEALASAGIINARGLREAVERLPDTLNDQYEITLQRIQSQSFAEQTLAMRIILWVTHAPRHLEVDELLEALTVDMGAASVNEDQRTTEETLVSVCLGLLTVEKESRTVRLIHFTAQEFFDASKEPLLKNPHAFIANICAIYLTQVQVEPQELTSHEELLKHKFKNPLIKYACYNLGHHTYLSMIESNDEVPMYVPKLFDQRGCAPIPLSPFEDRMDFGHAVHFAAVYGLVSLFEENANAINQQSLLGCSPLFYACLGGHLMLVERITAGCRACLSCKTGSGATILHAAVQSGNASIVEMLLSMCGFKVTLSDSGQCIFDVGPTDEEICIDINAQMSDGRTALCIASRNGYLAVVEALSSCLTVDPNMSDNSGWTPLHYATWKGKESVARLLLDTPNIDINAKNPNGWTPLYLAIDDGNESIVRLLLDTPNIDINAKESTGWTPLHLAVANGNESIVRLLLDAPNIDINAKESDGLTPLYVAVQNGNESIVRLLLDMPNIDINTKESHEWTPLYVAVQDVNESIIRLLLDTPNIDINAKESDGWTPLHRAVMTGNESIVQLLLDTPNIDINAKESNGWTPLHLAAQSDNDSIAELLLSTLEIEVNASTEDGFVPLHAAARDGHTTFVQLLIQSPPASSQVSICARGTDDFTPLHFMVDNTRLGEGYPSLDMRTYHGVTPLAYAAKYGHTRIVQLLVDSALVNVNNIDNDGDTPLMYAAYEGHVSVARILLSQPNILVNVQDKEHRRSALSKACDAATLPSDERTKTEAEAYPFVVLLLDHKDININLADDEGKTPLYYASSSGFHKVVELLQERGAIIQNTNPSPNSD